MSEEHKKVMTPEEFARGMKELANPDDPEMAHCNMDGLMCALLESLGYGEGVRIFEDAAKWYA